MPRSVRIEGSATPIIETSSASRKSAPHRTSSAPQARGLSRSAPPSRDGDWGVVTGSLLLGEGEGELRSGGLSPALPMLYDAHRTSCSVPVKRDARQRGDIPPRPARRPARQGGGARSSGGFASTADVAIWRSGVVQYS